MNGTRLTCLALMEGGKRQESGDTAGAWDCYRSNLPDDDSGGLDDVSAPIIE